MRECTTVLDRMSDVDKAQNIPQHKAKPIVKFIVPSPLEPLTTAVRRDQQLPCLSCRRRDKGSPQPAARNQERYRTAGRVLPRSPRGDPSSLKLRRDKAYLRT